MGAIHYGGTSFQDIPDLVNTDIIVLCTPIDRVITTLAELAKLVSPPTIITDVASVKGAIVAPALAIYPRFVGAHPMAGKETQGILSAEVGLFQDRTCVVCPSEPSATETVKQLWRSIGMHICECSPSAHDRAVAWISHLPVFISAVLIHSCQQEPDPEILKLSQSLASSGFRDTTRVGGGNPHLGQWMAEFNRTAILEALSSYQQHLGHLHSLIEQEKWQELCTLLENTHLDRQLFL